MSEQGGARPAETTFLERAADAAERGVVRRFNGRAGDEAVAATAPPEALAPLIAAAAGGAPFLARTLKREADWCAGVWERPPSSTLAALLEAVDAACAEPDPAAMTRGLRVARRRAALFVALADLSEAMTLEETLEGLSAFAERAVGGVVARLLAAEAARGAIPGFDPHRPGYVVLAMGKLGARELNYSSDIDLIALFDDERLSRDGVMAAKERFVRVTRELVKALSDITADGYVARVDLRLRPDPGATPVCLSMSAAETYYEGMGRTWERAAHIKARPIAGDIAAGWAYLDRLRPFIWRRHLDFAALEDASDMLARIRAHEGGADVAVVGQDVKLGAGGIREIEFFAQTHQLILGGRDPSLRERRTLDALAALTRAGRIEEADRVALRRSYRHLRRLEHRLQMIEDRQTHRMPTDPAELERVAALMGAPDFRSLESETRARMSAVRARASGPLDRPQGPRADALEAAAAALPDPERGLAVAQGWRSGRLRAARHPRADAALQRLTPEIMAHLAEADDPMRALTQFDRFLSGVPAGVQLFALFEANPNLLSLLTRICASAPRLAEGLARKPQLLDAVLDPGFFERPPPLAALEAELTAALTAAGDYERVLDAARRWTSERRFQIGVGVLEAVTPASEAGAAYSDVAEAALRALWPHIVAEQTRRAGAPPGRGAALLALGKLGSREMTASSDLDLIVVYDAALNDATDGARPLSAPQYYARLTQTLTSALTAPTAEGRLYDVDMRLRPSGNAGPLATSLAAFERYQRESAWVWEHMALTRARVVAGDADVAADVERAVAAALAQKRDERAVREAALDMRARLDAAHAAEIADPWALKYVRGGLMDLEFIAQVGLLAHDAAFEGGQSTEAALARLTRLGVLTEETGAALGEAYALQVCLQHVARVALREGSAPAEAGVCLKRALARAAAAPAFDALEAQLQAAQATARAGFSQVVGEDGAQDEAGAGG